jgi:hypothetical protein
MDVISQLHAPAYLVPLPIEEEQSVAQSLYGLRYPISPIAYRRQLLETQSCRSFDSLLEAIGVNANVINYYVIRTAR